MATRKYNRFRYIILLLAIILAVGGYSLGKRSRDVPASNTNTPPTGEAGVLLPMSALEYEDGVLYIHFIDVGQGSSYLLTLDNDAILVDGGPNDSSADLLSYLDNAGIDDIDLLVATHPDEDHIGSLDELIGEYSVDRAIMPNVSSDTTHFANFANALISGDIDTSAAYSGQEYDFGELSLTVLSPDRGAEFDGTNDYSVVLLAEFAGQDIVLPGDAEEDVEKSIIDDVPEDILLLAAGHHGSSTSSCPEFVEKLSPRFAVISCGAGNSYGHPTKQTLDTFEEYGVSVLRTDLNGDIVFSIDADGNTQIYVQAFAD